MIECMLELFSGAPRGQRWIFGTCILLLGIAAPANAQPLQPRVPFPVAAANDCPAPDLVVTRNAHLIVRYEGQTDQGVCLQRVGGSQQSVWIGIWPESWPEAATAAEAARHVLASPTGTGQSFTASFDWAGISLVSNVVWRFTVTNLGPVTVEIAGQPHSAVRIGWDEQSLGHPYRAHAEYQKDLETGVILSQDFEVLLGSSTTATDFWARYGGGPGIIPNFRVTAVR